MENISVFLTESIYFVLELLKAQAAGQVVVQGISEEEVEEMRKNQEAEVRIFT